MAAAPSPIPRSLWHSSDQSNVPDERRKIPAKGGYLLRLIAVLKFLKSASLIALSVGLFRTMHGSLSEQLERGLIALRLDPGNRHLEVFLARVSNLNAAEIKKLGIVGLIYAGLFLLEGTGLWLQRRWGEWVTVVITGMLIPVEVYEIDKHPSVAKVGVLLLNAAVVAYLVYRIRHEDASHTAKKS